MNQNCDLPILRVGAKPDVESDCGKEAAARKIYADYSQATVQIFHDDWTGSGFFIGDGTRIVTNAHVVNGARDLLDVETYDHKQYKARIEKLDDIKDLAIIHLENGAHGPESLKLGNSDALKKDEILFALGHPLGKNDTYISPGHFTAKGPFDQVFGSKDPADVDWKVFLKDSQSPDIALSSDAKQVLKTQRVEAELQIEGGNSGGPMINNKGEVVAVSQFGSESAKYHKYAWAVPSEDITALINTAPKFEFDYEKVSMARRHPVRTALTTAVMGGLVAGLPRVGGTLVGIGSAIDIALLAGDSEPVTTTNAKINRTLEYTGDAFMVAGAVLSWVPRLKPIAYASYAAGMALDIGASFVPTELTLMSVKRNASPGDKRPPLFWNGID